MNWKSKAAFLDTLPLPLQYPSILTLAILPPSGQGSQCARVLLRTRARDSEGFVSDSRKEGWNGMQLGLSERSWAPIQPARSRIMYIQYITLFIGCFKKLCLCITTIDTVGTYRQRYS